MKKLLSICAISLAFLGAGCEKTVPNYITFEARTPGYTFQYPKEHWSVIGLELPEGNPDNGMPHAAYDNQPVLVFNPVNKNADLTQPNPVLTIAQIKYPGSTIISSQPFTNPDQTITVTKYGMQEHTWISFEIPKESTTVVAEVRNPIKPPYPPGYEEGVEMILKTMRPLK